MPLICYELPYTTLSALNARILRLPESNPFRKECVDGSVEVFKQHDVLVIQSAGGFYFEHMQVPDLETELARHIRSRREYHCTTFEVDQDDPSVVEKLLDRFQEQQMRWP